MKAKDWIKLYGETSKKEKYWVQVEYMTGEILLATSYKEALELYLVLKKEKHECDNSFECNETKFAHRWVEN